MRTDFQPRQLLDPHVREAERALRTCIHCGFCTATCPTYTLLGDERDSPRGRIMLAQHMLESAEPPTAETVLHLDRCLSCLSCRTACPSGVDYSALIDLSRAHIEKKYKRPLADRLFRLLVLHVLSNPNLFAPLSRMARFFAPFAGLLPGRLGLMVKKTRLGMRKKIDRTPIPPIAEPVRKIALLQGCVQRVLAPEIDDAAMRVLGRQANQIEPLKNTGCCGALAFHLGKTAMAKRQARRVLHAFEKANTKGRADALLVTATGCAAFLKDYERVFAKEPASLPWARELARRVKDFTELAEPLNRATPEFAAASLNIAYHPPCSLQHGQRIKGRGEMLLRSAGFRVSDIPDSHLCCGSAGSYSLLQPEIAQRLAANKLAAIRSTGANVIASGNIGCLTQLSGDLPTVHIAQLLDWASGGPKPL